MVPLQACAGWAKTVNCHAHPRILLPQNRCLPEPFAAPFPHQPEPRCNTLDFAGKVVCQRAFRRSLDSSRQGTGKWGALMKNGGWYTFTNPERCVIIVPSTNGREGGGCSALQELTCWSRNFWTMNALSLRFCFRTRPPRKTSSGQPMITPNWANHTASKKKSCRNWLQANRTV